MFKKYLNKYDIVIKDVCLQEDKKIYIEKMVSIINVLK